MRRNSYVDSFILIILVVIYNLFLSFLLNLLTRYSIKTKFLTIWYSYKNGDEIYDYQVIPNIVNIVFIILIIIQIIYVTYRHFKNRS